jgi:hypothetical protein
MEAVFVDPLLPLAAGRLSFGGELRQVLQAKSALQSGYLVDHLFEPFFAEQFVFPSFKPVAELVIPPQRG